MSSRCPFLRRLDSYLEQNSSAKRNANQDKVHHQKSNVMKKILSIVSLLSFLSYSSHSQVAVFGHLSFQAPASVGEFRETSNPDLGAGARLNLYLRPTPSSPLQFGLDLGVFNRGHAAETVPVNIAGIAENFKVRANNGVGNFGFMLKLEPYSGKVFSPYIEGEAGGNVFFSGVRFNRKNRNSETINASKTGNLKGNWAGFYGGSAGLKIALNKDRSAGIELKCSYFKGGETDYNDAPRFLEGDVVNFERRRSTTDMLVPQIGVWVDFREAEEKEKR